MDLTWIIFLIFQVAAPEISMFKVVMTRMFFAVVDQAQGGAALFFLLVNFLPGPGFSGLMIHQMRCVGEKLEWIRLLDLLDLL